MTYSIDNLNEAQMRVIADALELYTRIRLGQIEEVIEPWLFAKRGDSFDQTPELLDFARYQIGLAKQALTGFTPTASWGIGAEEVPNAARVAIDVRDVIKNFLAWERKPEGGHTVDFHKPMHWGSEPLPTVAHKKDPEGTSTPEPEDGKTPQFGATP